MFTGIGNVSFIKTGKQIKTDCIDAAQLAQLLANGLLTLICAVQQVIKSSAVVVTHPYHPISSANSGDRSARLWSTYPLSPSVPSTRFRER